MTDSFSYFLSEKIFISPSLLRNNFTAHRNSGWLFFFFCKHIKYFTPLSYFGLQNHCRLRLQPLNYKTLPPWKKSYDQSRHHIKKQRHYFANKGPSSQSYGFSSSHVWMWELDYKESWALKNWCFWTVVLEKTLESSLDCKEIQPVHPRWNQSWIFIWRTDAEAETPVLSPPNVKNWLIWKDPDSGKDWRQEEKGMTGWDGWMASGTQWAWVWVNSRSWRWMGRPGMLQSMGLQRVRHDWATELSWTVLLLMWFQKSLFREVWCSSFFPPHRCSSYPWFSMGKVLFLWLLSRFFSLSLSFYSFNMKCLDTDFLVFILVEILLSFLELWFDVFH